MAKSNPADYIECLAPEKHKNYVLHNVVCFECTRPLFRVRWLYVVGLGLCILAVGFIFGTLGDTRFERIAIYLGIAPAVILSGLALTYLLVLTRKLPGAMAKCLLLFALAFIITFLKYYEGYGAINYQIVPLIWTATLYIACVAGLLSCVVEWYQALDATGFKTLIKGFPALSTALFVSLILINTINNQLHFLDTHILDLIQHHIFLREVLFVITIILIAINALLETINKNVEARKTYFTTTTEISTEMWSKAKNDNSLQSFLINILRPVWNVTLNIYKFVTELVKGAANYVIYLLLLGIKWFANYVVELVKLTWSTVKLVLRTLINLLRKFILPVIILSAILHMNFQLIGILYRHLHAYATLFDYAVGLEFVVILQVAVSVLVWLVSWHHKIVDTLKSVLATNLVLAIVASILTFLATLILWLIASVAFPKSPLAYIGPFTYMFVGAAALFIIGLQLRRLVRPSE